MRSLGLLTFAILLLAFIATSQASPLQKRHSFKVRSRSLEKRRRHGAGPHAMLQAYRKFGFSTDNLFGTSTDDLFGDIFGSPTVDSSSRTSSQPTTQASSGQTGDVEAAPENNGSEFLEKVTIGGQEMNLDFDTGSSDLWVFSTSLSQNTIGQHAAFDPQKSSTFSSQDGSSWQISYGDGSAAEGVVGTDTVQIGGATVTNQAVELATALSSSFVRDTNNDGLVGLAFSNLNTIQPQPAKTFFDNVMPSLKLPVFSVDLRNDNSGSYEFGSIDKSKVKDGQLTTVPVNAESGFWQFDSTKIKVGGQTVDNPSASPAIADTGTSLLLVDDAVAQAYYSQVQGAKADSQSGGFIYPCDAQLPDLSLAMGDSYMATIPGSDITFAQVDQQNCFGGVQSNGGSGVQIFGDTMFKSQYVVFDGQAKALYVGPKT